MTLATATSDWGERLGSEPMLFVIVCAIAVLAGFSVLSVAWLMGRSVWESRLARERAAFWESHGKLIAAVVGDPPSENNWIEAARAAHPAVLRHCLNEYLMRTTGEYKDGIARLYRGLGLLDGDLVDLRSRRWSVRIRALRRLSGVVTADECKAIAPLAAEGGEMRLLVAQIVGRIGSAADVLPMLASWPVTSRLSEYPIHVMVNALSPDGMRALLRHWEDLPSASIQRIVLDAAATSVPAACHDLLPSAARHPSLEVRIAAAHACGAMTSPQTLALLGPLAQDPQWEVRAQAVKALGAHPQPQSVAILCAALRDKSFWVRQNAAFALGRHGDEGIDRLRQIAATSDDRFARDAAEHVLADLGLLAVDASVVAPPPVPPIAAPSPPLLAVTA